MTNIDYKLAKQLKDAGFPQIENPVTISPSGLRTTSTLDHYVPTLSELIEACGTGFIYLSRHKNGGFHTNAGHHYTPDHPNYTPSPTGKTPEETLAKLWIRLNKKS